MFLLPSCIKAGLQKPHDIRNFTFKTSAAFTILQILYVMQNKKKNITITFLKSIFATFLNVLRAVY